MTTFVQVAVNVPSLAGVFDYSLPESLSGLIRIGHLVIVPFGKQTVQGVVLHFIDQPAIPQTKEIIEPVDPEPVLTPVQIELAESLAKSTLAPIAAIIGLFLPPGLSQQADILYDIRNSTFDQKISSFEFLNISSRLLRLLQKRGALRGRQIDRALPHIEWRKAAQYLVKRGMLNSQSVLPPASVRTKFVRTAQLGVSPEAAEAVMSDLGSTESTRTRRQKALRFLIKEPEAINVAWVYAESGCKLIDLQELA